jgi:hypothetical protein
VIEFQYGSVPGGTTGVTSQSNYAVCIADLVGIVPQVIIPGQDGANVSATGQVSVYPANRYIRFTPSGPPPNTPPTIAVSYNDPVAGQGTLSNQGTVTVPHGHTVNALNIDIAVNDIDANDCSLGVTITNVGATGIVNSEWQSPSAPVPYNVLPASGTFNTLLGASHVVTLTADDGATNTVFSFTIVQDPAPPQIVVTAGATLVTSGQAAAGTNRDFGTWDINAGATVALTVTIENIGGSNLTIAGHSVIGDSADFDVQAGGLATSVPPGGATTFTVAFDPATVGAKVATVRLDHNDNSAPLPFQIEVVGDAVLIVPELEVRQGSAAGAVLNFSDTIDFGTLDRNQSPTVTRMVFIRNTGTGDLTLGAPAVGAAEFNVVAAGLPAVLPPNGSITFSIVYQPTANGTHAGTVTFSHDDTTETDPFELNVTGIAVTTNTTTGGGSSGGSNGCAASGPAGVWWLLAVVGAVFGTAVWSFRSR